MCVRPYFTNLLFFRVLCHAILPNQCLFPMESKRSSEFEPEFMHFITKTSPCPYALHLLTSFKPLLGPFEPRLWTQPPQNKTHTPQWSHPTTHRHLPNLGLMLLGDAILLTAICMTRRFRSEEGRRAGAPLTPGSQKKKAKRNMRCSVANGWLENQMSRSCNQNQERKSQTIAMWWFQQLYAYFSRDKSLHHKFLYFSTGCVFPEFWYLEKWKVIRKIITHFLDHQKKSAKSHQPYEMLRTGVAFPAFLSLGKEEV